MAETGGRIIWDKQGERFWETGVDRGVLYLYDSASKSYKNGVAWNGLTAVTESPSGAEPTDIYADNIKYASLRSAETYGATIEGYTYPKEFEECDGGREVAEGVVIGQQPRKTFGLCYRTMVGNDVGSDADDGYKLHLVWGATASPSEKAHNSINDSPEATRFSWEVSTSPVEVTGYKPTATMEIDSRKVSPETLTTIEDILYGKDAVSEPSSPAVAPRLPLPDEIIALIAEESEIG